MITCHKVKMSECQNDMGRGLEPGTFVGRAQWDLALWAF